MSSIAHELRTVKKHLLTYSPAFWSGLLLAGCGLYLVLFISFHLLPTGIYTEKRLLGLALLLYACIVVVVSRGIADEWLVIFRSLRRRTQGGLFLFFLVGLLSAGIVAEVPRYAFLEVAHYAALAVAVVLAASYYRHYSEWYINFFLAAVCAAAFLYVCNVLVSYATVFLVEGYKIWPYQTRFNIIFSDGFVIPKEFLNFVHVRHFNHIQTLSLPLLALAVLKVPARQWALRQVLTGLLCGWWMLVFAADARGTMVASVTAIVAVLLFYRKKAWPWIRLQLAAAGVGLVLYGLLFQLLPEILSTDTGREILTRFTTSGRIGMWELALELYSRSPLLGMGPMGYAWPGKGRLLAGMHNMYLQVLTEWGTVAFLLFMMLLVTAAVAWVKRCRNRMEEESDATFHSTQVALTASLGAWACHSLVANISGTPTTQIFMVGIFGWALGMYLFKEQKNSHGSDSSLSEKEPVPGTGAAIGIRFTAAVIVALIGWSLWLDLPDMEQRKTEYVARTGSTQFYPRYWEQGVIGLDQWQSETDTGRR